MKRYTISVFRAWSETILDVYYDAEEVSQAIALAQQEFPGWECSPVGIA
jgi:hypothetical protein